MNLIDTQLILNILDMIRNNFWLGATAYLFGGFGLLFGILSLMRIRRINKILNTTKLTEYLEEVNSE